MGRLKCTVHVDKSARQAQVSHSLIQIVGGLLKCFCERATIARQSGVACRKAAQLIGSCLVAFCVMQTTAVYKSCLAAS